MRHTLRKWSSQSQIGRPHQKPALMVLCSCTSSLQDHQNINCCGLSSSNLWLCLGQPKQTNQIGASLFSRRRNLKAEELSKYGVEELKWGPWSVWSQSPHFSPSSHRLSVNALSLAPSQSLPQGEVGAFSTFLVHAIWLEHHENLASRWAGTAPPAIS